MSVSDDFAGGMITGIVMALVVIALFALGNCSSVKTMDYPEEKKECVIRANVIEECYPNDQTE